MEPLNRYAIALFNLNAGELGHAVVEACNPVDALKANLGVFFPDDSDSDVAAAIAADIVDVVTVLDLVNYFADCEMWLSIINVDDATNEVPRSPV